MRILLNLLAASAGGHLTRAAAFLDRFPKYAEGAELVILKEKSVLKEYKTTPGREIIDVSIGLGDFKAVRRGIWENIFLPRMLRRKNIDVYLTFSSYLPRTLPNKIPSVVGVSNLAPFSFDARETEASIIMRAKMTLLKSNIIASGLKASQMIALSETCKEVLVNHGIEHEKISVVPNGIEDFWFEAAGDHAVLNEYKVDSPYLLYVSNFYHYKNFHRLLSAFSKAPDAVRENYKLLLIGRPMNRSYYNEVVALRSHLGLADKVIIIPGLDSTRLRSIYNSASLFIFPSLIENCPNILLEAMAVGLPVIASSLAPMPEFGGAAAEYFDPLNENTIAMKMCELLGNELKMDDMRRKSIAQAKKYSWDSFTQGVIRQCRVALDS